MPSLLLAHHAVMGRAKRDRPAPVLARDQPLIGVPRFWPLGIRFQVVNQVSYSWVWQPRLEWSADGETYELVPQELTAGVPFRLGHARNADDGEVIATADFVLPVEGGSLQEGVIYQAVNPAGVRVLGGSAVTEIEFVVRATSYAEWLKAYYFRVVDDGVAPAYGNPVVIVLAQRPPEPTPLPRVTPVAGGEAGPRPPFTDPHQDLVFDTSTCAACHRTHTAVDAMLLAQAATELCLSCHDGTAANSDVLSEYEDPAIPANDPDAGLFYSHQITPGTSADEASLRGLLNRTSACTDCHNPHTLTGDRPVAEVDGWSEPGALHGATGVTLSPTPYGWIDSVEREYNLCLKCHSTFTQLRTYPKLSQQKTDKLADIDPTPAGSYHPVAGAGNNASPQMTESLAGGTLWQLTTDATVRCVSCHATYQALAGGGAPLPSDRLAPHVSTNAGILIAEYRSKPLKPAALANDYDSGEFALCFLCHSAVPFADDTGDARADTRFRLHGYHLNRLYDEYEGGGTPSLDIDEPGAGAGNAICSECHFRTHSTRAAVNAGDRDNRGIVNFAPNVQPEPVSGVGPVWQPDAVDPTKGSCTLLCHDTPHTGWSYGD